MSPEPRHRRPRPAPRRGRAPLGRLSIGVAALLSVVSGTTYFSAATFTESTSAQVTVVAAYDLTPPTVRIASPSGGAVAGTVEVAVDAQDARSAVVQVVVEVRANVTGSSWTTLCADTTLPWGCTWNTALVADGSHLLRATATDAAGYSTTSDATTVQVANGAAVDLADVPAVVRGSVPLSATVVGAAGRTATSAFSYRLVGSTGNWTTITGCGAVTGTTPTCSWATTGLTDDYDVRVVTTLGSGTGQVAVSDTEVGVLVDNTAPTASLTLPTTLSGTVAVAPAVTDDDSGVDRVVMSYRRTDLLGGSATPTSFCTDDTDPYRCLLDTTTLVNGGTYEISVVAFDEAGNQTSVVLTNRRVDNTAASTQVTSPSAGSVLRGTTTLTADATAGALGTATNVQLQRRAVGGAWVTVCTDPTAPYSCAWDTTQVASGSYEVRSLLAYTVAGVPQTPVGSTVVAVTVDNNPLRALDVQALNGGAQVGRADAGDTVVLTFSTLVDLTSIRAGWDGSAVAITTTMRDKAVNGALVANRDRLDLPAPLGQVAFATNVVRKNRSATIPATMVAGTATVGGVQVTTLTLTLGTATSGLSDLRTATTGATLTWSPLAGIRSATGVAGSTTPATESGALDADL